ncbi:phage tail sheath family protein [Rhodobacteraceae bacterium F11138]|nr:phage tail sheath family protein [Rhodobacteraceae bacterium F11138]
MYKHPGVYIEHVPSNMLAIEAASTSITAFVGHLKRGTAVTDKDGAPEFVSSVSQYAQKFGPLGGGAGGIRDEGSQVDAFGHAVNAFFANGGSKAYIVPVAKSKGTASSGTATLAEGDVKFTATSPGKWATGLVARITSDLDGQYTLTLGTKTGKTEKIKDSSDAEVDVDVLDVLETFADLKLDPDSGQFVESRINQASLLVTAKFTKATPANAAPTLPLDTNLTGGSESTAPGDADFQLALDRLRDHRSISIVVLPGLNWKDDKTVYERAITHAEFMQNRMVLIDPENPESNAKQLKTPKDVQDAGFPTSPYSALYYPYLKVANPFYDPETAANLPATFEIGPSGMAAGLWGRIDGARGVWKAPAGLEATVRGALGPNVLIGNAVQDNLNEWGINCMRSIIGPTVVWGGRTLATKSQPQYRYIPVRRTQNMIGESLYSALQSVVFEPNDHKLWSGLRAGIGNFMDGLHRAGAFQGEKASDAYFVNCGLGSTMTQGDIDAGIVRVVVGFAPLKPAEFVVVQIQQIVAQAA